jgi:alpha-amylase/alpha-mannosidase (GH57 family)
MLKTDLNKYVCIHGHFYQPPRENAWLGVIEYQASAAPFHHWNERINFECYAPNSAARLLNERQEIKGIVSNYAYMSFNIGPTLLAWMEKYETEAYNAILEADKHSLAMFNGHGAAIAQVYNHIIMPLANRRDKITQVKWGIYDFESRFHRKPEGIWLAETAVDTETLEILADHGIKYTILAPRQAKAFKKLSDENWTACTHSPIDSRNAYQYNLPSGKNIVLFFYDGNIAQAVAFNGLLNDGKLFAEKMASVFDNNEVPQLSHIATDGESYGHHHSFGEMALAACFDFLRQNENITITNYGQYIAGNPPLFEVQIHENSSWSCVHGVERWRDDCGCQTGGQPSWNQIWRKPLRNILDELRDRLIPIFKSETATLLNDPWSARNDYIQLVLDRNPDTIASFFKKHAVKILSHEEKVKLLRLLEMQRHTLLMFTSCGWFFDEISGLETDQILQYAHRAMHYAEQVSSCELREQFLQKLRSIPSNVYENGAVSYEKNVIPAAVSLERVGMHYAASSLFEDYPEELSLFNYQMKSLNFNRWKSGTHAIAAGRALIISHTTLNIKEFAFVVLYLGQYNLLGQISLEMSVEKFESMKHNIDIAIKGTDLGSVIGIMQDYCGGERFSFWHLFRDEKRKIVHQINQQSLKSVEYTFRGMFQETYPLMQGLKEIDMPIPAPFKDTATYIYNLEFKNQLISNDMDLKQVQSILQIMREWTFDLIEIPELTHLANKKIYSLLVDLAITDENIEAGCSDLISFLTILKRIPLTLNLWRSQNFIFSKSGSAAFRKKLANGSLSMDTFQCLLQQMGIATLDKHLNPV